MTALAATAAVAGGIAANEPETAAAVGPRMQVTADMIAEPAAIDPRPIVAQHKLQADAAQYRAHLRALAKAKAARAKAVRARAEAKARASRAKERARLLSMDPRSIARALMGDYGFGSGQFSCLNSLWQKESGWNLHASNPSSGAYGIPQALPGSKMGTVASDWRTNPATQIKWGLQYIRTSYGSPCAAWGHSQSSGWY
ncbi:aggregation-promoting factor C-terminal-like domain-containing protein [Angustibacter luteus]|uniref:Lytic transglycosylase domain-containing protein n=1 Tax=Angustibacter luteus TaxID=658456 RepID=A0ABW1JHU7_9ACTN